MGLKIGIIGLPNVGKSTLFNALLETKSADSANFPFCTIEPNKGIVNVPDSRLQEIAPIVKTEKIVPAYIEFIDIAGLVAGASKGEGLGNQFLANIRETDAICQVVRVFENADVTHVNGNIDPKRDIDIIQTELVLKDLETLEKRLSSIEKKAETGQDKSLKKMVAIYKKLHEAMDEGQLAKSVDLNTEEESLIADLHLLTRKPFIYIANVAEGENIKNIKDKLGLEEEDVVICICAKIEQELTELPKEERDEFKKELGMDESALDLMIKKAFSALDLITYITAGEKEVKAWTIKRNTLAPQAAAVIHTDFEKGFIKADVVSFDDFMEYNGWNGVRDNGKFRQEGKEYIVKDGDIMLFKIAN